MTITNSFPKLIAKKSYAGLALHSIRFGTPYCRFSTKVFAVILQRWSCATYIETPQTTTTTVLPQTLASNLMLSFRRQLPLSRVCSMPLILVCVKGLSWWSLVPHNSSKR